jgi:hypothetical protein
LGVEKHESTLSRLGSSDDGEHSFTGVIMGNFGDGDSGSGKSTDFSDLGAASTARLELAGITICIWL